MGPLGVNSVDDNSNTSRNTARRKTKGLVRSESAVPGGASPNRPVLPQSPQSLSPPLSSRHSKVLNKKEKLTPIPRNTSIIVAKSTNQTHNVNDSGSIRSGNSNESVTNRTGGGAESQSSTSISHTANLNNNNSSHGKEGSETIATSATKEISATGMLVEAAKTLRNAIKTFEASLISNLPYEEVPPELCYPMGASRTVHLGSWSLIVTDNTLRRLAAWQKGTVVKLAEEKTQQQVYEHISKLGLTSHLQTVTNGVPQFTPSSMVAWRERDSLDRMKKVAYEVAYEHYLHEYGVEEVHVPGAETLGDPGISAMAAVCGTLKVLDVTGALLLTDLGMRQLAKGCTQLETLKLGGCLGIGGAGVGMLGQCCKNLKVLNLSGCKQLGHWAFQSVFTDCTALEELNLDGCSLLGDVELKTLASHCPNIKNLYLNHCLLTTDVGLSAVAHSCTQLERFEIQRKDTTFRVTDVILLALGGGASSINGSGGCAGLCHLDLRGCDHVTDAGLGWLAEGCKLVTRLDLTGCHKLTDAGVTALAEGCNILEWLSLRGAMKVTDRGMTRLGSHCPKLKHLDVGELYLLSDGNCRGFAVGGIQALAAGCPDLESLVFDHCFRIVKYSLQTLGAKLKGLKHLSMHNCPNITLQGISAIAGPSLTSLDLTNCGACITDAMVACIAQASPQLQHAYLAGCQNWGLLGIKNMCMHCRNMITLDIAGCVGVTDDALIHFQDYPMKHLKSVNLLNCTGITSVGVQWLALPSPALLTLNIKGTKANLTALNIIKEHFPYSRVKLGDKFLGLSPLKRCSDRKSIRAYHTRTKAASAIQNAYRSSCARVRAKAYKRERIGRELAREVTRLWLMYKGQALLRILRADRDRKAAAALKIQQLIRHFLAVREVKRRRRVRFAMFKELRARDVQRCYRGLRGRRKAKTRRAYLQAIKKRQLEATLLLQRCTRGYMGRERVRGIRHRRRLLWEKRDNAARRIAKAYKSYRAREIFKEINARLKIRAEKRGRAAITLQLNYRCWVGRRMLASRLKLRKKKKAAAICLQRHWRGCKQRINYQVVLKEWRDAEEFVASSILQSAWKIFKALKERRRRALERSEMFKVHTAAAIIIQNCYRMWHMQVEAVAAKKMHLAGIMKLAKLETWGAVIIQKTWRGLIGRRKFKERKIAHMKRWKEMFDQEKQVPFYFSQITAEVRWRRPQDMLELLPRPICGNCEALEGYMECSDCCDVYCSSCYHQVHSGGKRKLHKFRAIYDYYGKRVDYGDGEFPSIWPTDIEQDDINGWRTREVTTESNTEWSLLEGGVSSSITDGTSWDMHFDDSAKRTYFFNTVTGESTYETPQDILQLQMQSATPQLQINQEWTKFYDDDYGAEYYHNFNTGVSQYDRPEGYRTPQLRLQQGNS